MSCLWTCKSNAREIELYPSAYQATSGLTSQSATSSSDTPHRSSRTIPARQPRIAAVQMRVGLSRKVFMVCGEVGSSQADPTTGPIEQRRVNCGGQENSP